MAKKKTMSDSKRDNLYYSEADWETKRDQLRAAAVDYVEDAQLHSYLANAEAELQNWENALSALTRTQELLPRSRKNEAELISRFVVALHKLDRDDEALAMLEERADDHWLERYVNSEQLSPAFAAAAYERLLGKLDGPSVRAIPLWHALMTSDATARHEAADKTVAVALALADEDYSENVAQQVLEALAVLGESLDASMRATEFAEFARQITPEDTRHLYAEQLGKLAAQAGDGALLAEAVELLRFEDGDIYSRFRCFDLLAKFGRGDIEPAIAELSAFVEEDPTFDIADGLCMLPWDLGLVFPEGDVLEDLGHPISRPAAMTEDQLSFEQRCLTVLANAQPDEPFWLYAKGVRAKGQEQAKALAACLDSDSLNSDVLGLDYELQRNTRLALRCRLLLGRYEDASKLREELLAQAESGYDARTLIPYEHSELGELPKEIQSWINDSCERLAKRFPDEAKLWEDMRN